MKITAATTNWRPGKEGIDGSSLSEASGRLPGNAVRALTVSLDRCAARLASGQERCDESKRCAQHPEPRVNSRTPPPPPVSCSGFDVTSTPTRHGIDTLIAVSGAFDTLIAPTLQRTVDRIQLTSHDRVILDLHDVQLADHAGLRVVLCLRARCVKARCELVIRPAPPSVRQFFTQTHAAETNLLGPGRRAQPSRRR
jgi:anti-anti-sigma factor